jgi:muramoyltetrapeptide carboxypeptidase
MNILKPKRLVPGDAIAVVSPASPSLTTVHQERGIEALERMGYRVVTAKHTNDRHLLFAGNEMDRARDINTAFKNESVKAIICTRGGCGTSQVLPHIDFTSIAKNPKIFIGYSDITALQIAILNATGLVTFYGPMVATDFSKGLTQYKINNFINVLTETKQMIELKNPSTKKMLTLCPGVAEGQLAGGCLSIVVSTLGTGHEIDTKDKILFFEDIDEQPHRIDRYLTQLIMAGKLQQAKGIIFGPFTKCEYLTKDNYFKFGVKLLDLIKERIFPLGIPSIYGLQFGHVTNKLTIPFGGYATLDATNCRVNVEPCVA